MPAPRKGEPFGAVQVRHNKPALKGEVDASVTSRRRGCIVAALVYVNPSVTAYAVPVPRKGEPFGVVLCAKIYELTLRLEQGRLTHCRSQFSLFLPVLRFASSAIGGAQLRTSPAARRILHGAAIFHIAKAIFHPFVRTDFTARKRAYSIPSSAVSIASSTFSSFAVSAAANCAFSGWHRALRL